MQAAAGEDAEMQGEDAEMQGEDANFFHHWENICAEQLAPGHHHQGNECCETTVWVRLAESSGTVTLLSLGGLEKLYRVSMSRKAS